MSALIALAISGQSIASAMKNAATFFGVSVKVLKIDGDARRFEAFG